jgi:hypothetical protein
LLGIASPSKVFEGLGNFTAEGFAVGVASNDNAQGALADMTAQPDIAPGALGGKSKAAPMIGELHVHVSGGGDEKFARLIAEEVARTLENLAAQVGGVPIESEAAA